MFVGQTALYFASIRKLTAAVGSIFKNITITRFDDIGGTGNKIRTITVPISYASGDKSVVFDNQHKPAQSTTKTKISFPRIAYQLTDMQYDATRKTSSLNRVITTKTTDPAAYISQLNPVPYNFVYEVYVGSKTLDDGFQIIEQILPAFGPSFNLRVHEIPEMGITRDIPVIFDQISKEDIVEGLFDDERILIWTLTFTAKGYLYPTITDANIIKKVLASIYNNKEMNIESKEEVIQVSVDPIDATEDEDWSVATVIYDSSQLDSNGDPI